MDENRVDELFSYLKSHFKTHWHCPRCGLTFHRPEGPSTYLPNTVHSCPDPQTRMEAMCDMIDPTVDLNALQEEFHRLNELLKSKG